MAKNQNQNETQAVNEDGLSDAFAGDYSKAKPSHDGTYPLPGEYIVKVLRATVEKSVKDGANMFIANTEVITSTNPERPAGSRMTYLVKLTNPYIETKLGQVRGFIAAALAVDYNVLGKKELADACRSNQPLRGKFLSIHCYKKAKKDKPSEKIDACEFEAVATGYAPPARMAADPIPAGREPGMDDETPAEGGSGDDFAY